MVAFFLLLSSLLFFSCDINPSSESHFTIMNWNVQALMDMNIDGDEFSTFSLDEYDKETYRRRIRKVCDVVDDINPDIAVFEEVENSNVLKDMMDMYLSRRGYLYYGSIKEEGSAISIGFISKIIPNNIKVHKVEGSRDILSLDFNLNGEIVRLLACHAKSQFGGADQSENLRIELTKTLRRVINESEVKNIICIGDFNEDPSLNEFFQTALYDVDKENSFYYRNKGSLLLSSSTHNLSSDILYSPQLDISYPKSKKGTYVFNNEWFNFDLALFNCYLFDQNNIEFESFSIYSPQKICTSSGIPYKWDEKSLSGISDHFPIYFTLSSNINSF